MKNYLINLYVIKRGAKFVLSVSIIVLLTAQITKAESYRKSVLDALLDFVEDEFHIISFSLFPDLIDIRPFSWRQYSSRVMYLIYYMLVPIC